jgi:hypothetical protein
VDRVWASALSWAMMGLPARTASATASAGWQGIAISSPSRSSTRPAEIPRSSPSRCARRTSACKWPMSCSVSSKMGVQGHWVIPRQRARRLASFIGM